ncbi:MAG: nucleotide-binding protein [Desulfobacterales bacterium]|nr:MAG: nucleotide-binding protein [Desulfobacterales bacterium]
MRPMLRVFVASSSEQIEAARGVANAIGRSPRLKVGLWEEDVFEFSKSYIESLENELERADFAVVVLTADDPGNIRGKSVNLPRDNVIFELGLFAGRLGRDRCFFFVDGDSDTQIASDLSGVKPVNFYANADRAGRSKPDLATQAARVQKQMLRLGPRYKPARKVREGQAALWRFSSRLAGHWWERMRDGEDDASALSYVTITVDEVTNTPRLEGKSYGKSGEPFADWHSVTTGVVLGSQPTVFYRWEGGQERAYGQTYAGHGFIEFDDDKLESGAGEFNDTNLAKVAEGAFTRIKHFGMYRCGPRDIKIMNKPWTDAAVNLVAQRLKGLRGR